MTTSALPLSAGSDTETSPMLGGKTYAVLDQTVDPGRVCQAVRCVGQINPGGRADTPYAADRNVSFYPRRHYP